MRGNRDLNLVVGLAAICAVVAPLVPVPILSLIFAAPLALILPGYAIVAASFARRELAPAHRVVLSIGVSLGTLALVPLLLNLLPGGISSGWWSAALFAIVLGASRAAAISRPRPWSTPLRAPLPQLSPAGAGALAVATLTGVAAVVLIYIPLPAPNATGYTEFWIEPLERDRASVRVGVASREQEDASYTIELRVGGLERPFAYEQAFLRPGESANVVVAAPRLLRRDRVRISATLFKAGELDAYRRIAAWTPPLPE